MSDVHSSTRPVWAEIDLEALAANYRELVRRVDRTVTVIASIKANAYGHGAVPVAHRLAAEGVDMLATGSFDEALAVREAGVSTPILLFAGPLPEAMEEILRHGLIPTVHDRETAAAVSRAARRPTPVWVKVDAGLGRLGITIDEAEEVVAEIAALPNVLVEGLYTHLPFTDEPGRDWAAERVRVFEALADALVRSGLPIVATQAVSSAGALAGVGDRSTAICPGHALYGIPPASADVVDLSGFRPVLHAVKTRLVHVATHRTTRTAGTGGGRQVPVGSATGVVPFGRTDGYRSALEERHAVMLVHGRRAPVLGVSLEHTTLDLSGHDGPSVGDEVVVLGEQGSQRIAVAELAGWQGATVTDIVLSFDRRLPRRYL